MRDDVMAEVKRLTGGAMATVVYDAIGRDMFPASLDSLRPRGHLVSYGNASGPACCNVQASCLTRYCRRR